MTTKQTDNKIEKNTISVDGGYSIKSGIMDYKAVWTDTEELYFIKEFINKTSFS